MIFVLYYRSENIMPENLPSIVLIHFNLDVQKILQTAVISTFSEAGENPLKGNEIWHRFR